MSANSFTARSITRDAATRLIAEAIAASKRIRFEAVIAIVDAAGNLKAFERSDRSSYLAVNIAIDKAYTAASFGLSTAQWVDLLEDRGASNLRHVPRVMAAAGGFPIMEDGAIIGGIGISGGSWTQDQEAGEEALRNFSK
ncbi:GlcG/HbpS family heme-binding protein [Mesorhizobium sp. BR1-1-2]|uniref:GlcG/HbpS family heme-binding protein n=1 Tax=Mesorhizobium sp. BR1-1-2 TaxID=2876652 RepID=UPI001CCC31B3|nr:heme-binding protein [Mesorhizobium sp. BR1-1-2]MBZ9966074.1 heme-binding protein [Mesorhizobium sp. BR1-1-2]